MGEKNFKLDESVQYTVWVKSTVPICACFGGFGSFISNNGGGLPFDDDPSKRRLIRYRYNTLSVDSKEDIFTLKIWRVEFIILKHGSLLLKILIIMNVDRAFLYYD